MPPFRTNKKLPLFMEPFKQSDFQGHFQWTEEFTKAFLDKSLFHACHLAELNACLDTDRENGATRERPVRATSSKGRLRRFLGWRTSQGVSFDVSIWRKWLRPHAQNWLSFFARYHVPCQWRTLAAKPVEISPSGGYSKSNPGVWVGMNRYRTVNRYGPCLITFPMEILNGRKFMAFHRKDDEKNRIFFVQDESRTPIYTRSTSSRKSKTKPGRSTAQIQAFDPAVSFKKGFFLANQKKDVYDIVLTEPVPLIDCTIRSIEHNDWIPKKCAGFDKEEAKCLLEQAASKHLRRKLKASGELRELVKCFRSLAGETLKIKLP